MQFNTCEISTLEKRGIGCPFMVVHPGNLISFLSTTSIEEVEVLAKKDAF